MDAAVARVAEVNRVRGLHAPVSPASYYRTAYKGDFCESRRSVCATGSQRIRDAAPIDEILSFAAERSDVYLHAASFFAWPRMKTMHRLYSFKIDLDKVSRSDETLLLGSSFFGLMPTFVIRSGAGLHLDYILSEPVECYHWRIPALKKLLEAIQQRFRCHGSWRVDPTPLTQAFRVVGSRTKAGAVCQAFPIGAEWDISALADAAGVPDPTVRQDSTSGQGRTCHCTGAKVVPFPTGGRGFYGYVRKRIAAEVREGNRETALFALAVIGKKYFIPRETVEADVRQLYEAFAARGEAPMHEREIACAMAGHSLRYIKSRSTTLERWLGFEFPRTTKRNGNTRKEHSRLCNARRAENMAKRKRTEIAEYVLEHPNASNREIARALGMCHKTVAKYRQAPSNAGTMGVGSSIAYNTPPLGGIMGGIGDLASAAAVNEAGKGEENMKELGFVSSSGQISVPSCDIGCQSPDSLCPSFHENLSSSDSVIVRLRACKNRIACSDGAVASVPQNADVPSCPVPDGIRERLKRLKACARARMPSIP